MLNAVKNILHGLLSFLYPEFCMGCGDSLAKNEKIVCVACRYHLPKTNYHLFQDNKVSEIFWGRVYIEHATSLYFFRKNSIVQHLLHQLKYKGKPEIGVFLGKQLGYEILNSPYFKNIDAIVPLPLHPRKQIKRGYNQSECIADGIAQVTGIAVNTKIVYKNVETKSQTKKTRIERLDNVASAFEITNLLAMQNKHILLVDDVLTTGATLEACALTLKQITGLKISIATVALASNI